MNNYPNYVSTENPPGVDEQLPQLCIYRWEPRRPIELVCPSPPAASCDRKLHIYHCHTPQYTSYDIWLREDMSAISLLLCRLSLS